MAAVFSASCFLSPAEAEKVKVNTPTNINMERITFFNLILQLPFLFKIEITDPSPWLRFHAVNRMDCDSAPDE